ncbi:MAG: glycosyltransferase [Nocardioides sp.]
MSAGAVTVRKQLQRQILPIDKDLDVMALYVDLDGAELEEDKYVVGGSRDAKELHNASIRQKKASGRSVHPDQITSRTTLRIELGERVSFGTYFNGFPAGYWRRWSIVDRVRLSVTLVGAGAAVTVYKSMANGRSQRVDSAVNPGAVNPGAVNPGAVNPGAVNPGAVNPGAIGSGSAQTYHFDLSLGPFVDGGWYWYDVTAGDEDAEVSAVWSAEVPEDRAGHGTVDMAITTMNRPDFCAKLIGQIAEDEQLRPYLDAVLVMDQGTQPVTESEFFGAAATSLGDKLRVLKQGNLGGSGGYARGQLESVRKGTATYAMMMDDDVVCEPEGIIRAITFGDLARRPTIVGGHMFSLYARSRMHSFGEIVVPWRFWWRSPEDTFIDWDFAARNLRSSRWLHKRLDADFNGWFMCLIPRLVLEQIGLSLPLFIKWDDSEFGLRAKAAGFPTVVFPGAAVWHVPWTDKNDALDWQAYFHQRNRFVAALLHSPYEHGGRMVRESLNQTVAHLVAMQYSTVELRLLALRDVLDGPARLHRDLATKLGEVNTFRLQFADAQLHADLDAFPPVRRTKPPRRGKDGSDVPSQRQLLLSAVLAPVRHFRPVRPMAKDHPEAAIAGMDLRWYRLVNHDSVIASMPDGTSAALYRRDPAKYRTLLAEALRLHKRMWTEWPHYAKLYRDQLGEITSPETWEQTFAPWRDPAEGSTVPEGGPPVSGTPEPSKVGTDD